MSDVCFLFSDLKDNYGRYSIICCYENTIVYSRFKYSQYIGHMDKLVDYIYKDLLYCHINLHSHKSSGKYMKNIFESSPEKVRKMIQDELIEGLRRLGTTLNVVKYKITPEFFR